jgi:hypothetical protein
MVARRKKYEVAIHNRTVRDTLYQGERNRTGYADDWAQTHYVEVSATSEDDARRALLRRYPPDRGFVVEAVVCIEPD